jgi:hypothetical protein
LLLENITWQELGLWEAQLRKLRKEEISSFLKKVKKGFSYLNKDFLLNQIIVNPAMFLNPLKVILKPM